MLLKISSPSAHGPNPATVLICPASPIFMNSLFHCFAKNRALSMETHGSFVLATTMVLNENGFKGIGSNPLASYLYTADSISLGATSNAPLMIRPYVKAQYAIAVQARLCPISTT